MLVYVLVLSFSVGLRSHTRSIDTVSRASYTRWPWRCTYTTPSLRGEGGLVVAGERRLLVARWGGLGTMSENDRRAADRLTIRDVAIRLASMIGLIAAALGALVAAHPL